MFNVGGTETTKKDRGVLPCQSKGQITTSYWGTWYETHIVTMDSYMWQKKSHSLFKLRLLLTDDGTVGQRQFVCWASRRLHLKRMR